jgi:hypothetical protein
MAKLIGRAVAAGRRLPSMECALVCLLLALSLIGSGTGLDGKVRAAATGAIASLYGDNHHAVRGVPIPKEAVARVQSTQPFSGVQAQAGRNP